MMNQSKTRDLWLFLLLCMLLGGFYIGGKDMVPFHPDESTQIFMSEDFNRLFKDPLSMAWKPGRQLDNQGRLRALDAPLTKYWIGFFRALGKTPPLASDWDWTLTWAENALNGAVPSPSLLRISRLATTSLIPVSLYFLYYSGRSMFGKTTAFVSVLLLGTNPLILLHARRAMAESALLLGVCFFIWTLSRKNIRPWLVGLALAAAINAKQTALALVPAGIIAVCWPFADSRSWKSQARRLALLGSVVVAVTFLLNPFFWRNPVQAVSVSIQARSELSKQQREQFSPQFGPQMPLFKRSLALLGNLYLTEPSHAEAGNYLEVTAEQVDEYFSCPLHRFGRSLVPGSLFLVLSVSGFIFVTQRAFSADKAKHSKHWITFLGSFLCQLFFILFLVHLPWQRYIIPLLPFTSLLIAVGLKPLLEPLFQFTMISNKTQG